MWGSSWGTSWAGGAGPFSLLRARAVGARTLRVEFTAQPRYVSPIGPYDAGNLRHWSVTRLDTAASLSLLGTRPVEGQPLVLELLLASPFLLSPLVAYRVEAEGIISAQGLFLVDPVSLDFAGMPAVRQTVNATRPLQDVANSQTSGSRFNGALAIGTSGDYQLESGAPLLKKLIYRRLLTALGEFYHLADTGYGAGLMVKELVRPGDLIVLRTQLEAQVLQEAGVRTAEVGLQLKASGQLIISARVSLDAQGQQFTVQFPVQSGGSQVG